MRKLYIIGRMFGDRGHFIMSLILQLHRQTTVCLKYNDLGNAHDYVHSYFREHTNRYEIAESIPYEHLQNNIKFTGTSEDPLIIENPIAQYEHIDFESRKIDHNDIQYICIETDSDEIEEIVANDFYKATAPYSDFIPSVGEIWLSTYNQMAQTNDECRPNLTKLTDLNLTEQQIFIRHIASFCRPRHKIKSVDCLRNIPSDITIHKIKFRDIISNKELVLSTLEKATGFNRTLAISQSYDNYVEKQRILYEAKLSWL